MFERLSDSFDCARESYIFGIITFVVAIIGYTSVGQVYGDTASRFLVEALIAPMDTLAFAVITSSATILSLLMAVLGFANRQDDAFSHAYYVRIWFISVVSIVSLLTASGLLLLISIPITETESLTRWYTIIYWVLVVTASSITALLVAEVIALFQAVTGLIEHSSPDWETNYLGTVEQKKKH